MKIAVLGLGMMGALWARQLAALGHEVRGWNRSPKGLLGFTPDVREAVWDAEATFLVLSDAAAVEAVLKQIVPVLGGEQLVIQSSTVAPKSNVAFASWVEKSGADFLEAPFAGSKLVHGRLQTVYYLGGEKDVVEKARPLLETISSALIHVGPLGSASAIKLAMNINMAGVAQALCESLAFSRAAGVDDGIFFEALSCNSSHSKVADGKGPKLHAYDYSPQFSLRNMDKDLRLALETAAGLSLSLEQTAQLKQTYSRGMAAGWEADDFIGLIRAIKA